MILWGLRLFDPQRAMAKAHPFNFRECHPNISKITDLTRDKSLKNRVHITSRYCYFYLASVPLTPRPLSSNNPRRSEPSPRPVPKHSMPRNQIT